MHVQTRQTLLALPQRQAIEREKIGGTFIYLALESTQRQRHLIARAKIAQVVVGGVSEEVFAHEVKAGIILFFGLLEPQRRLLAGLEALKVGRGGDARVAALLGVDPHTVAKGRIELLGGEISIQRGFTRWVAAA